MQNIKGISKYEKIIHWLMFLSFLGLATTALAANFFFSKEAIMESFKSSLPMLELNITPSEQLFIARIERRETWDIHLYLGLLFTILLSAWVVINLVRKNSRFIIFKSIFFISGYTLAVSGIWMWLRLYVSVSEEAFALLKKIHYCGYMVFIFTLIFHIFYVIYAENKLKKGILSDMVNFKSFILFVGLSVLLPQQNLFATEEPNDLERWVTDINYLNGVMYLEGDKGAEVLTKEIKNCPYEKCKLEDLEKKQFGVKTIEIKKPDLKKAIELLRISSNNGNALASDRLMKFLIGRIDYKSKIPSDYLLNQLKEETGLSYDNYKAIINKTWKEGIETNKSCLSEYYAAEIVENGYLGNQVDTAFAKTHYQKASLICPEKNLFKVLSTGKVSKL